MLVSLPPGEESSAGTGPRSIASAESVSECHPDKLADQVSDAIVDACLTENPRARVAVETLLTSGRCVLAGEVRGVEKVDLAELAARRLRWCGSTPADLGVERFEDLRVDVLVRPGPPVIAGAVDGDAAGPRRGGAGDQGILFGYATNETPELMPAPLLYATRVLERLAQVRKAGEARLGADGRAQLTVGYSGGKPCFAETLVVSHQCADGFEAELARLIRRIADGVLPDGWVEDRYRSTRILVNPSGSFVHGGPATRTGLTGQRLAADTYGGAAPHGGGALSGKDPSHLDRSGAYAARWLAKNVVAAGIADRCLVKLAYAPGVPEPVSFEVDTFGTAQADHWSIERAIHRTVDLGPGALRERLALERPIYDPTATYGHFGRTPQRNGEFSWERTDLGEFLLRELA